MQIKLRRTPKRYFFDTHRALTPVETLRQVETLTDKVGITEIEDITGRDKLNIPVYSAYRPGAKAGAVSVHTGKGLTGDQARVSVLMEAIERYSAEIKEEDRAKFHFESYNEGNRAKKVEPSSLILSAISNVTPDSKIEWCEGYDLMTEEEVLLPANAVYHPYTTTRGGRLFRSDSNGIASGNNLEEAIFHGIMEVIERDALSYVEIKKDAGKRIAIEEDDGLIFELKERFNSQGIETYFWYIPTDVGFPTVALALDSPEKNPNLLVYGAGTHSDPKIAAIRAITEAAQSRLMQIVKGSGSTPVDYEIMKRMNRHWFETKDRDKEAVKLSELPALATDTIDGDIKIALEQLRAIEKRVIVVDLTRKEIGIPVVRVIIPGFEVYARNPERLGHRYRRYR
ncbi:MAG: YcaO-related McrA-glycine thioamidation protein [Methanophagales archaeon]|nr:YcaO-related McrA-glycine thioamidation protein [Methanophagales archaeon]MCW3139879.1 YcaO-related McrA-glycine thioamidation protein [Methanophagales archaeon]MCW7069663.1 YcaO-related McrA-glycine thioamidation protein [Methanophagales archaeon]MCW7072903.1 YcaO-related McrA-glycine thioamidation protein [Methanophagales archaeon]